MTSTFANSDVTSSQSHFNLLKQVYDVTKFLEDHPGGDEVLLSATGAVSAVALMKQIG